jgi:lipopolysaccharide/colanic/teichoic acid biosynthesis glycosyltransferase
VAVRQYAFDAVGPMAAPLPGRKRAFDVILCIVAAPLLLVAFVVCALAVLMFSGRPLFYVSPRRTHGRRSERIVKFRAMVPNADRVVNREAVPVTAQSFLNLPPNHEAYTAVGRWLERCCLTELPQAWQVLRGQMTLVGNRPLPESVIAALRLNHPEVERRFDLVGGIAGPVQLVGRDRLRDGDRIRLEIAYCQACQRAYSFRLDLTILFYTVLVCVGIVPAFSAYDVERWLRTGGASSLRHYVPIDSMLRWPALPGVAVSLQSAASLTGTFGTDHAALASTWHETVDERIHSVQH